MSRPRTSTIALASVFVVSLVTWSFVRPEAVAEPGTGTVAVVPSPVVEPEPEPSPVPSPTEGPDEQPSPSVSPTDLPSPSASTVPEPSPGVTSTAPGVTPAPVPS